MNKEELQEQVKKKKKKRKKKCTTCDGAGYFPTYWGDEFNGNKTCKCVKGKK